MDSSLDDIINNTNNKRDNRNNNKRNSPYTRNSISKNNNNITITIQPSNKERYILEISNLHWNVTKEDLEDLFGQQQYPGFTSAKITYDSAGRSIGDALVEYDNIQSANNALEFFHNREFDQMPMQIKLEIKKPSIPKVPIKSRLGSPVKTINERLGVALHDRLGPPASSRSKKSSNGARTRKRRGKPLNSNTLDHDLDRYMAGEVMESRKVISYEEVIQPEHQMEIL